MDYKDYYKILGVARDASQDDIKRAHRKLTRKYHPDINKAPEAEARFKDVGEAYEVLKDPEKRAAYDQLGQNWQQGEQFRAPPEWDRDFSFSGGGFSDADSSVFSDFFESLFGRGARAGGGAARRTGADWARQGAGAGPFRSTGQDQQARVTIDLEDAIQGASRTLTLGMQEVDRAGRVRTRDRTIAVRIPKGVTEGQLIRLKGQGQPGLGGGPAGDLYLEVAFAPHPHFRVEGRDIYLDLPVTPWEAALGGKVKMPTPGGTVDITIPANARSGQKLRLKGRGIPGPGGGKAGHLIVVLTIVNPPVKTEEARALYRRMAQELAFDPRAKLMRDMAGKVKG